MKHSCRLDQNIEQTGITTQVYCAFNPSDTLNNVNTLARPNKEFWDALDNTLHWLQDNLGSFAKHLTFTSLID